MRDIVLLNEQIWENWTDVGVVAAWGLFGLVVTVMRFRWEPQEGQLAPHGGAGRPQREARGRLG